MAGSAKGHEIVSCMSAAFGDGDLVMNLCRRNNFAVFLALLTKRMLCDVAVTNSFPGTAILLVNVRGSFVFVVLASGNSSVIFTVLSVRELGASGIGTRSLGSTWHVYPPSSVIAGAYSGRCTRSAPHRKPCDNPSVSPPFGHEKSPVGFLPRGSIHLSSIQYNIATMSAKVH